jgi:hypothetical protein
MWQAIEVASTPVAKVLRVFMSTPVPQTARLAFWENAYLAMAGARQ